METPKPSFSQSYLCKVWSAAGIPDKFVDMDYSKIDKTARAKPLWDLALKRAESWTAGESTEKGLVIAGSEGTGKSLALWANARAAAKSWLIANPPKDTVGVATPPIYCRRFKDWLRFEFCPSQDGKRNWNFELIHEMLESKAIFLDDLTLDVNNNAFRPLCEFIELLVDDLTVMRNPPPLYITTNNSSDDWTELLGKQLVDRIVGPNDGLCTPVKCVWKSYR